MTDISPAVHNRKTVPGVALRRPEAGGCARPGLLVDLPEMRRTPSVAIRSTKPRDLAPGRSSDALVDPALIGSVERCEPNPLDADLRMSKQVVNVPVPASRAADMPKHAGGQRARGSAGVDVTSGRKRETPESPDGNAQVD